MNYKKIVEAVVAEFRFRYIGGGYFRDKTVPVGKKADVVHGEEVVKELARVTTEALQAEDNEETDEFLDEEHLVDALYQTYNIDCENENSNGYHWARTYRALIVYYRKSKGLPPL